MCLITPFKDKKVATQDMIVYKALSKLSPTTKTITEVNKKWFGLKKIITTKTVEVPRFLSEHQEYVYMVGEVQPKVVMEIDDEYRASSDMEWNRVKEYAKEHCGFVQEDSTWNGPIRMFTRDSEDFICVTTGYHSYADIETAKECMKEAWDRPDGLIKCIIPAGAEYYEGFGFLVSNQIIVTGEVAE